MNLYGGVFSMKRVAYSVETKYKVVEMKLKGFSTREIMDTLKLGFIYQLYFLCSSINVFVLPVMSGPPVYMSLVDGFLTFSVGRMPCACIPMTWLS